MPTTAARHALILVVADMSADPRPLRIAQLSDIHCGELTFDAKLMESIVERINEMGPDLVIVAGDLTAAGYEWEFAEAADWLEQISSPRVVVPGNHDARNVGYLHFEHYFGDRFSRWRAEFEPDRAAVIGSPGVSVIAVDSSEPDLNEGQIGRERYPWIREQITHPDDLKIFVIHHHLVAIPGTGRERNTINDAGDVLAELSQLGIDMVLSGHKHVPFFWGISGLLICNSGTATTKRLRGLTPSSWNELEVDSQATKVYLHYEDGRRELACVRSRRTRAVVQEGFYITEEFLSRNHLLPLSLP